jgi:DNA-directed RNA polymerase specialized sigma24 family protein
LRIIGGLSAEQTAEVLGRRAGAVRALQHRGLLALQQMIEGTE